MKIVEIKLIGHKFDPSKLEKFPIYEVIYAKGKSTILYNPSELRLEKLKHRIVKKR